MRKLNFITEEQYQEAKNSSVTTLSADPQQLAPHLRETIRLFLEEQLGRSALYNGLQIKTTLNQQIQKNAQAAFQKQISNLRKQLAPQVDGALVALDVNTGAIKALIGGFDFAKSQFNRAIQAKRQMGSLIKPLIYAAAIEQGHDFSEVAVDEPLEIIFGNKHWTPDNFHKQFEGEMTLAYALSHSNNTVTVKVLLQTGIERVVTLAKKMGLSGPIPAYPSLALGCIDTSLLENTAMFNVFANSGRYVAPHFITWVKDQWGTVLWRNKSVQEAIFSPMVTDQVAKVLMIPINRMCKRQANGSLPVEAFGKTGTSDNRTCWFLGATPALTIGIYIGRDDNVSLGEHIYGYTTAWPIWFDLVTRIPCSPTQFCFDPRLREIIIHERTGQQLYSSEVPGAIKIFVQDY